MQNTPSQFSTTCKELSTASLKCFTDNPHNRGRCADAVKAYKDCIKEEAAALRKARLEGGYNPFAASQNWNPPTPKK